MRDRSIADYRFSYKCNDLTGPHWQAGLQAAGVRSCAIAELERIGVRLASDLMNVELRRLPRVGCKTADIIYAFIAAQ